jgi:hypothetical protein
VLYLVRGWAVPGLLAAPRGDRHGVLIFPRLLADRQIPFRPPLPLRPVYPRSGQDPL